MGSKSFQTGEHTQMRRERCIWRGCGSSAALSPHLALCTSSIWLFPSYVLYHKLVTVSHFSDLLVQGEKGGTCHWATLQMSNLGIPLHVASEVQTVL